MSGIDNMLPPLPTSITLQTTNHETSTAEEDEDSDHYGPPGLERAGRNAAVSVVEDQDVFTPPTKVGKKSKQPKTEEQRRVNNQRRKLRRQRKNHTLPTALTPAVCGEGVRRRCEAEQARFFQQQKQQQESSSKTSAAAEVKGDAVGSLWDQLACVTQWQ